MNTREYLLDKARREGREEERELIALEIKNLEAITKAEREKAEVEREKAEVERDKARVERDKARVERDKARVERDKAEKEKFVTASKMLKSGFEVRMICDFLSLSPEQVEQLK